MEIENNDELLVANAFPAKAFFVNMLTRDIDLSDSILDLLDNCVDGILRTRLSDRISDFIEKPYEGFWAEISMNENYFEIKDNCGGIPLDIAKKYAFMMGRNNTRDKDIPTVGMYGIGMKRALFKIGRHAEVYSTHKEENFIVEITEEWMKNDDNWKIPIKITNGEANRPAGTCIKIEKLNEDIAPWFSSAHYVNEFLKIVSQNYSMIIAKGFEIVVNGKKVNPAPMSLMFDKQSGLAPFVYEARINEVDITLQVGFARRILSEEEAELEQIIPKTKDESGWTIICNDRVVLYKDKTLLTGWGEANVPAFHNQFNGITGYVIFKTNKPENLPITTTKRGIEGSSQIYLRVKNQMRTGLKLFTDYTNNWKKRIEEEEIRNSKKEFIPIEKTVEEIPEDKWRILNASDNERVYKPLLPQPKEKALYVQISFRRKREEVEKVAEKLFDEPENKSASKVGEKCFEEILKGTE